MTAFIDIKDVDGESYYINIATIATIATAENGAALIYGTSGSQLLSPETPKELMHRIQLAQKYAGDPK